MLCACSLACTPFLCTSSRRLCSSSQQHSASFAQRHCVTDKYSSSSSRSNISINAIVLVPPLMHGSCDGAAAMRDAQNVAFRSESALEALRTLGAAAKRVRRDILAITNEPTPPVEAAPKPGSERPRRKPAPVPDRDAASTPPLSTTRLAAVTRPQPPQAAARAAAATPARAAPKSGSRASAPTPTPSHAVRRAATFAAATAAAAAEEAETLGLERQTRKRTRRTSAPVLTRASGQSVSADETAGVESLLALSAAIPVRAAAECP